eukprot:gene398-262_t
MLWLSRALLYERYDPRKHVKRVIGGGGAPRRFIRVGESMYRVANYRLAYKKYFGKPLNPEQNQIWDQNLKKTREYLREKAMGKTESSPETFVDLSQARLRRKMAW